MLGLFRETDYEKGIYCCAVDMWDRATLSGYDVDDDADDVDDVFGK
ncbi:MAG: hypothetical protein LBG13_01230 [Holosporales bacterium]|jgi:hypothetical protein|nr:hypothetical protein [Holosporales bacterium]